MTLVNQLSYWLFMANFTNLQLEASYLKLWWIRPVTRL